MCGRYNVSDAPSTLRLMAKLKAPPPEPRKNVAPGAKGQFVVETLDGERQLLDGYWSLLIEPKPSGLGYRPNPKLHTFNARSDRLTSSPLWRERFRDKRVIIPVDGFHEWRGKQCYQITQPRRALALGGLYDTWIFGDEQVSAFSIITLPPHPKFAHIHDKSLPLMLDPEDFDLWLDPKFSQVDAFHNLLQSFLRHPLNVTPVDSAATLRPIGMTELIPKDP